MDLQLIVRILRKRRRLRAQSQFTREEIEAHRETEFAALRAFAYESSPFYKRFHRGLQDAPLTSLPVLTKGELMADFDEIVTDRRVHLADVEEHLRALRGNEKFLDRYWVARTSGSTGHPGIFLADEHEWASIIASYARAQEWAGIDASVVRRTRLAVVSSRVPWHQSARVGMSVDSPFIPVRRFDATQPLSEIVAGLNDWQPENLIAYASMARVLAEEQLEGRLRISPRAVMCSSEVLTQEAIVKIERAWKSPPFNVYAATEPAGIASDCRLHRLHLYEDLVITEVVDEKNHPVPNGEPGAKILVTVLFSRTQPLIRYEMSDRVSISQTGCDCGLPFRTLQHIEGRAEDFLVLRDRTGGKITVHPNVFHRVLEPLHVKEWQVVQEPGDLRVLLAQAGGVDTNAIVQTLSRALADAGAAPIEIRVELVDAVTRTALGKAPLVKALR